MYLGLYILYNPPKRLIQFRVYFRRIGHLTLINTSSLLVASKLDAYYTRQKKSQNVTFIIRL